MDFYRVYFKKAQPQGLFSDGGPFYVPREFQGQGRHDITDDGILYASVDAVSSIAENLKRFINLKLKPDHFVLKGDYKLALARFTLEGANILDLREAKEMVRTKTGPVSIATHDREITQALSRAMYQQGVDGFLWWSTLEAKWTNATLFENRIRKKVKLQQSELLTPALPEVRAAAKALHIQL